MTPLEVQARLRKRPFEPFRLYLNDGRAFDIRYPRLNLATEDFFVLGIPHPTTPDPLIAEGFIYVVWSDLVKVEQLPSSVPAQWE